VAKCPLVSVECYYWSSDAFRYCCLKCLLHAVRLSLVLACISAYILPGAKIGWLFFFSTQSVVLLDGLLCCGSIFDVRSGCDGKGPDREESVGVTSFKEAYN
jgi:hypothetical protein